MEQDLQKEQKTSGLQKNGLIAGVIGLVIFLGSAWYFLGGGLEKQTSKQMDNVYQQVASDAVNQYRIAERQGDKIQICVQAGFVSAAYLQAQDEANYNNWKEIEKTDCARAGMPQ